MLRAIGLLARAHALKRATSLWPLVRDQILDLIEDGRDEDAIALDEWFERTIGIPQPANLRHRIYAERTYTLAERKRLRRRHKWALDHGIRDRPLRLFIHWLDELPDRFQAAVLEDGVEIRRDIIDCFRDQARPRRAKRRHPFVRDDYDGIREVGPEPIPHGFHLDKFMDTLAIDPLAEEGEREEFVSSLSVIHGTIKVEEVANDCSDARDRSEAFRS